MIPNSTRVPVPECLLRPMEVPEMLLLGPGPANLSQRVCTSLTSPILSQTQPELLKIMDDVKDGLKYLFQTNTKDVFCISGTGNAGLESVLTNLLEPGDLVLICKNGFWGHRAAEIVSRLDAHIRFLEKPLGEAFSLEEIEKGLSEHRPSLLLVIHVESSTGVLQPIEGIGNLCTMYGALLAVDTVASLGGVPFYMDEWGVDVSFTGTQKVLNCPPSLAPVAVNAKTMLKITKRKTPPRCFYFDFRLLAHHWGCYGEPRRFHHTSPATSIYALREGLAQVAEAGLENLWHRHSECAKLFHDGIKKLGLELFVKNPLHRAPTITTITVPSGVCCDEVTKQIVKNFRVEIFGGLGPSVGYVWRVGLLGDNCTKENVQFVLRILEETLSSKFILKNKL